MKILDGYYNSAKVFTDNIDPETEEQVVKLLNQKFIQDFKVRIMPDCHAGKGCVIGTTMTIKDKVVPNLVGVDIGCGMFVIKLGDVNIDLEKLDNFIKRDIPHGFGIHKQIQCEFDLLYDTISLPYLKKSDDFFLKGLGSLGGGNHFIEIDIDKEGNKYLVIHCGSRNFGLQVANFYQNKAIEYHKVGGSTLKELEQNTIANLKALRHDYLIQPTLEDIRDKFKNRELNMPPALCYLEGRLMEDYLHDLGIAQTYALFNREVIASLIMDHLEINYLDLDFFHTIHNYIDLDNMIMRKGAVSAQKNELLIIPINMEDGAILAVGKGNEDWNYSAPHGAGRLMSRKKAKEVLKVEDLKQSMEGIYTTTANIRTLDEAPKAYKPIEEILENIQDTVEVVEVIKPIYNFKDDSKNGKRR